MPEGDTIRAYASQLHPVLCGKELHRVAVRAGHFGLRGLGSRHILLQEYSSMQGRRVADITTQGKHMFLLMDEGPGLRVHLGMDGFWRTMTQDEYARAAAYRQGVVLAWGEGVVVCFSPMEVEWLRPERMPSHPKLVVLGPDLLGAEVDFEEIKRRAMCRADDPVGVVLLDQQVAAGIGNVIRSEVLFMERTHPLTPTREVNLQAIYERARSVLQHNSHPGMRVTTDAFTQRLHGRNARLWVYERGGRACLRCNTRIERQAIGDPPRNVWWCPRCQQKRA